MLVLLPRKELAFQVEQVVHQLAPNAATAVAVGKWKGMEEGVIPSIVLGTPKPVYEVRGVSSVLSIVPTPRVWEEELGDVTAISSHFLHLGAR